MPPARIIEVGAVVGRLTVVVTRTHGHIECRCACGTLHSVSIENWGKTQSCGCLKRDRCIERSTKHGMAETPEYEVWADMKGRCTRPSHPRYDGYGGRGIYSPDNCIWATYSVQMRNRRSHGWENRERDELGRFVAA